MLTFTIRGDSHEVTAEQYQTFLEVGVRVMKDAASAYGVEFTINELHASAPTVVWQPRPKVATVDVDTAFVEMTERLAEGIHMMEHDEGVPDWMAEGTAKALYQAAALFEETEVTGLSFADGRRTHKMTRQPSERSTEFSMKGPTPSGPLRGCSSWPHEGCSPDRSG